MDISPWWVSVVPVLTIIAGFYQSRAAARAAEKAKASDSETQLSSKRLDVQSSRDAHAWDWLKEQTAEVKSLQGLWMAATQGLQQAEAKLVVLAADGEDFKAEIAALKAEIAALKAEIAALKAKG